MRNRDSFGPDRQRSERRTRAVVGSLSLLLCAAMLTGTGCPVGFEGTFLNGQEYIAGSRDVAVIKGVPGSAQTTFVILHEGSLLRVEVDGPESAYFSTDVSPDDPERVLKANINADTTPDVLVKLKSGLAWAEGHEGGPFVMKPFIFVGPIEPFNGDNFAAFDVDNDNDTDVAVACTDGAAPNFPTTLRIFANNGAGGFTPGQVLSLPGVAFPQSLTAEDVNGDTRPDLLVVSADACRILVGQPDGTFRYLNTTTGAASASPTAPLPGAFTGRLARLDAGPSGDIVLSPDTGGVVVRLGNGNGTFQPSFSLPGITSLTNVVVDNFDADNLADIAMAGEGAVAIYHGTAGGGYETPRMFASTMSADRVGVFTAPGQSRPSLFTVHKFADVIQTYLNTDQGWQVARRLPFVDQSGTGLSPRDGTLVDLNGDGFLDVAAGDDTGLLSFTLNTTDGAGTFGPTRSADLLATITQVHALKPLAGQGDARQPVVTTHSPFRFATIARLDTTVVPNVWAFPQTINFTTLPTDVTSADVNADGREDLVFCHAVAPGSISLALQGAAGVFGAPQSIAAAGGAWNVACAADLDGVNGSDVLVADTVAGKVQALMNNGAGGFVAGASFLAPAPLGANVAVGDITGDGKPDIIVGCGPSGGAPGAVRVYPTEAGGAFGSPLIIPFVGRPVRVAAHDINGDGRIDIVAATKPTISGGDGVVGLVLNSATGITTNPPTYHYTNGDPASLGIGDLRHSSEAAPDGAAKPTPTAIVLGNSLSPSYENMTLLDTVTIALPCPGDANGDRVVDFIDLNIVLSDFGTSGAPGSLAGDLDGDGDCDFIDLNIVLSAFGTAC